MTYHSYRTRSSKPSMCFWPECHLVVAKFYDVCCLFKEKITWHLMSRDINSPTCWLVMVNFLDILEWKRCTIIKCSVLNWRLLSIVDCFLHADLYKKEIYVDIGTTVYISYFSYLSFSICKTPPPTTSPFTMSDHPFCCHPSPTFTRHRNLIGASRQCLILSSVIRYMKQCQGN